MREIKFKIWIEEKKEMLEDFEIYDICLINKCAEFVFGKAKFLQYTGLKDKIGKEIYEGDVIRGGDTTYFVEWDEYHFRFSIKGKPDGFSHYQAISMASQINKVKVIGNIYENTNLVN